MTTTRRPGPWTLHRAATTRQVELLLALGRDSGASESEALQRARTISRLRDIRLELRKNVAVRD